jgi:phage repressor protein C with HTH and peptisase S24 domain
MFPTIQHNDLVLIDTTQSNPQMSDQIFAVSYCGLGCVKRLRPTKDGGWLLMADNPAISPITAYDGELHVLGRVVAFFRKI